MVRVKFAPRGTGTDTANFKTGATDVPAEFVFIIIEVKRGWVPAEIVPEVQPALGIQSMSVCTVMPAALPAVAAPMVRPLKVIVKAVPALIPATAVVMTMEVAPGAPEVAVMTGTEVEPAGLAAGVAEGAKNPEG